MKGVIVLAILVAAGTALWMAYQKGEADADARWAVKWAEQGSRQAESRATAEGEARTEEKRRQAAVDEVGSDARKQSTAVAADIAGADAAGERLHAAAEKLAAGSGAARRDTGAAERSQAATRAAMVLSDLLKRADQRAGELAAAYDSARIAGQACEAAYDRVRNTTH